MPRSLIARSLISGTIAAAVTSPALLSLAALRAIPVWRALNCTAHWLDGPGAADDDGLNLRHTGVGHATNHAACVFWAFFMEAALGPGPRGGRRILATALATAAIAVPADYLATPKRFTPGWEFVLRRRDITIVYVAMGLGLALGGRVTRDRGMRAVS